MVTSRGAEARLFKNEILAGLPSDEIAGLAPGFAKVLLTAEQVIHEQGSRIADVFFVESGIVTLTADTGDEAQVEVGLIGHEGFVGTSVVLNRDPVAVHRAFVQAQGSAYRISSGAFRIAIERSETLRDRCLGYVETLMIQTAQTAACNARHEVAERLARWLLITRDRLDSDHLPLTHEFLSIMLGVRRAGISLAAETLQMRGLIRQSRGRIMIIAHDGLLAAACDCYRIAKDAQAKVSA